MLLSVTLEQELAVWSRIRTEAHMGDTIEVQGGKQGKFIRLKEKKFTVIMDDTAYDYPVMAFARVVEKAKRDQDAWKKLATGDLFVIFDGQRSGIYEFRELRQSRGRAVIIGIDPVSRTRTSIAPELFAGKIEEFRKS